MERSNVETEQKVVIIIGRVRGKMIAKMAKLTCLRSKMENLRLQRKMSHREAWESGCVDG